MSFLIKSTNKTYKPYNQTYTISSFTLLISGLFPAKSRRHFNIKLFMIFFIVLSLMPITVYYIIYSWNCILNKDVTSLIKQLTVGVLLGLFFFKFMIVVRHNNLFSSLLHTVTTDLLRANSLEHSYQCIYNHYIKQAKLGEFFWAINGNSMMACFPLLSIIKYVYGYVIKGEDKMTSEYMVHEMEFVNLRDKQFETPYFEVIWLYMTYICTLFLPSFVGFDSTFCVLTTHAALKIKLMAHALSKTFEESKNKRELKYNMGFVVRDHQDAIDYYNRLQQFYSIWLFIIFFVTTLNISLNLYLVTIGDGLDTKYTMFACCCVIHSFIPCTFSSILFEVGEQLPNEIYACGWEDWQDPEITRMVAFMIARAQQPMQLTGAGFVPFNMMLFIKIVKTAYSLYTLLRD